MRHVHVADGALDDVLAAWRAELGDAAWIRSRDEAIADGWFGTTVTDVARGRIGDVVAAARGTGRWSARASNRWRPAWSATTARSPTPSSSSRSCWRAGDGVSPEETPAEVSQLATRVFDMARHGDVATLAAYVDAGVPVNLTNDSGDTLVMLAAYHGHAGAVAALVARGADVNRLNDRGQSPLAGAVFKGEDDVVRALLAGGADPAPDTRPRSTPRPCSGATTCSRSSNRSPTSPPRCGRRTSGARARRPSPRPRDVARG